MAQNKLYKLTTKQGEVICEQMIVANQFFSRLKGLMFSESIPNGDGFLINPCRSIHTFFMLYPLDLVFLDENYKVIKVLENFKPWRMSWIYFRATQTLELKGGHLKQKLKQPLKSGDTLEATCIN